MINILKNSIIAIVIAFTFIVSIAKAQKQSWYKGYQYYASDESSYEFKYTRKYIVVNDDFLTIYNVYSLKIGRIVRIITAKHIVKEKKVVVEIKDAKGGVFSKLNEEECSYKNLSLKPFGFRGTLAALKPNMLNQLMVKFSSSKFQYINIMEVNGTENNDDNFFFYLLDEED
jgi:hypothetical protein